MQDKYQTAFRLHIKTINRLDALVKSPPGWLENCAPGPVKDRTDVVERLVFLAEKHSSFGMPSEPPPEPKAKEPAGKSKRR